MDVVVVDARDVEEGDAEISERSNDSREARNTTFEGRQGKRCIYMVSFILKMYLMNTMLYAQSSTTAQ